MTRRKKDITMTDATTDPALYLREGILGTRWKNGDRIEYVSPKTATMMARHIVDDGPLTVLVLDDDEALIIRDALDLAAEDWAINEPGMDHDVIRALAERLTRAVSA